MGKRGGREGKGERDAREVERFGREGRIEGRREKGGGGGGK